ncbi:Protein of unknown function [Bacillus cereus]|nr:Protein of unknown function [Bacillus wiedmannii]SCC09319.1 Protein of unknown function [Bacillus cereus]SCC10793.1 Protein of unknown function [Bacillus thuringiensis]SCM93335.1 Protein of unknown function [Bacillus mycoides]SCC11508.1 Protein of unknown function [Bacillus wiedmannii]
MVKVRNG